MSDMPATHARATRDGEPTRDRVVAYAAAKSAHEAPVISLGAELKGRINAFYLATKAIKSGHLFTPDGKRRLLEQFDRPILRGISDAQRAAILEEQGTVDAETHPAGAGAAPAPAGRADR